MINQKVSDIFLKLQVVRQGKKAENQLDGSKIHCIFNRVMSSATKLHRDYATEKCCDDVFLCKYLPVRSTHFSNKPTM